MSSVDSHLPIVKTIAWTDEAATQRFASALAARPDVRRAFIELQGELGAGKTTFVRHLLRALGVAGRIKSPTYAVVEPHEVAATETGEAFNIWHFDFYRFNDPREWEDAGFRDIFASAGLKLAEWPDKATRYIPQADLTIRMDVQDDDVRAVTLTAHTALGRELLA